MAFNEAERRELEGRTGRRKIALADAMRAEIALLATAGRTNPVIAARLGITQVTVAMWRQRFAANDLTVLPTSSASVGASSGMRRSPKW